MYDACACPRAQASASPADGRDVTRSSLLVAAFAVAAILVAGLGGIDTSSAAGSPPTAHAARATLAKATATGQMRAFLQSAVQVTAVRSSFTIRRCNRRGPRTIDCTAEISGRSTVAMRAKLLGGRNKRVQLYVVRVTPAS